MSIFDRMVESIGCALDRGSGELANAYHTGNEQRERELRGPLTGIPGSWEDASRAKQLDERRYDSWVNFRDSLTSG